MVNISQSKPIVFGYTPWASSGVTRNTSTNTTKVNQDIKTVTEAIKASVSKTSSNRTTWLVAAAAGIVIAGLGAIIYSQNTTIEKQNSVIAKLTNLHFRDQFEDNDLHPNYSTTPFHDVWTLEDPDSGCREFLESRLDDNAPDLSALFRDEKKLMSFLTTSIGKKTNLESLVELNCLNILEALKDKGNYLQELPDQLIHRLLALANKTVNIELYDYLIKILRDRGVPLTASSFDSHLSFLVGNPDSAKSGPVELTVSVSRESLNSIGFFLRDPQVTPLMRKSLNEARAAQADYLRNLPEFVKSIKAGLKDSLMALVNASGAKDTEEATNRLMLLLELRFGDNAGAVKQFLNENEELITRISGLQALISNMLNALETTRDNPALT